MQEWIDRLVSQKYKTYGALARAIKMTDSGFGRAVRAGTFETENLLRLADETGESASVVFELANKASVNALIERLYGKARAAKHPDAAKAAEMMALIEDRSAREGFLKMMDAFLHAQEMARRAEGKPAKRDERHR